MTFTVDLGPHEVNRPRTLQQVQGDAAMEAAYANMIDSAVYHGADMPVGAAVSLNGDVVGAGFASDQRLNDHLLHAEVMAMMAADKEGLEFDAIYTTLEPCTQCQDIMAQRPGLKSVTYSMPRTDASERGIVKFHAESAAERVLRKDYGFEVIRHDIPQLRAVGCAVLDSYQRDLVTQKGHFDMVRFVRNMADLAHQGIRLSDHLSEPQN